jgi:hypothetical protein
MPRSSAAAFGSGEEDPMRAYPNVPFLAVAAMSKLAAAARTLAGIVLTG